MKIGKLILYEFMFFNFSYPYLPPCPFFSNMLNNALLNFVTFSSYIKISIGMTINKDSQISCIQSFKIRTRNQDKKVNIMTLRATRPFHKRNSMSNVVIIHKCNGPCHIQLIAISHTYTVFLLFLTIKETIKSS